MMSLEPDTKHLIVTVNELLCNTKRQTHNHCVSQTPSEPESMVMSVALHCLVSDDRAQIYQTQQYLLGSQQLTLGERF